MANFNFNSAETIQETRAHEIANSFMAQVYVWMSFGLAVTGGLAWYAANSEGLLRLLFGSGTAPFIIIVVVQLGIVFYLSARVHTLSPTAASGLFVLYAALNGVILAPVFFIYTSESIASTFFVTAGTFGAMSLYGYTTKRDLSNLSGFLMMGLIGLILASVVNIWLKSEVTMWVITYIAIIVFVLLTAYDTQKIKKMAYELDQNEDLRSSVAVLGALSLYLDFVVLFIHLLRILGKQK
ncbi:MAG: Bax inhibitor-1/YccA family protein [Synergistaceae bacterium]|nr:Bax inhibitor-1/YccA family protein [Synergistaceae bacterium]